MTGEYLEFPLKKKHEIATITERLFLLNLVLKCEVCRKKNPLGRSVEILGEAEQFNFNIPLFCHLWFAEEQRAVVTPVASFLKICFSDLTQAGVPCPHKLNCQIPENYTATPVSVSIVQKECEHATNSLRVQYNPLKDGEEKGEFALCLKG